MISGSTHINIIKTKEESEKIINSWFCPINPISQTIEYFYNQRKHNG